MKLSVIIDVLKFVAAVAMTLRQLILAAEEMFPGAGSGSKKFAFVRDAIMRTAAASSTSEQVVQTAGPIVEQAINDVVASYNADHTLPRTED